MLLSALEAIRAASAESLAPLAFFPPPPPPTSPACLRLLLRTSCSVGVDFLILLPQLKLGSTTSAVENINFATSSPQHLPFMAFTIVFTFPLTFPIILFGKSGLMNCQMLPAGMAARWH